MISPAADVADVRIVDVDDRRRCSVQSVWVDAAFYSRRVEVLGPVERKLSDGICRAEFRDDEMATFR